MHACAAYFNTPACDNHNSNDKINAVEHLDLVHEYFQIA